MISSVDTNVLLDVLLPDAAYLPSSKALLDRASSEGALVICEVVYVELACQFSAPAEMDVFLTATGIRLTPSGRESLLVAGDAWRAYLSRRDGQLQCSSCGCLTRVSCPKCGSAIASRQHVASDFIIGAHSLAYADRLLTRDTGFYRTYFPSLRLND